MVDYVLVLTVTPGFSGQKYLDYVDEKIERFVAAKDKYGYKVIIDGACSPQVIAKADKMGVDGAVLGTSAVFGKGRPHAEIFKDKQGEAAEAVYVFVPVLIAGGKVVEYQGKVRHAHGNLFLHEGISDTPGKIAFSRADFPP